MRSENAREKVTELIRILILELRLPSRNSKLQIEKYSMTIDVIDELNKLGKCFQRNSIEMIDICLSTRATVVIT